ncbi:MAG TPA: DUF2252 domain-containing protein [Thermoleophilaceae bacterium]|nr:DUF2252 domain-containing protein [Thermoleophilaceae bacterium]
MATAEVDSGRAAVEAGPHLSPEERAELGRNARSTAPRSSHADWTPASDRPDPIELLEQQAATRVPELVPIRYGRMAASPFAFFRGAAYVMASDLAETPTSGFRAQLCGDAHLSNFGGFASPERDLLFDLNDFDETLPGPWEWDVKRLMASIAIAGRDRGFSAKQRRTILLGSAEAYRMSMQRLAGMGELSIWYERVDEKVLTARLGSDATERQVKQFEKTVAKAKVKDSTRAFAKLTSTVDGEPRIISDPPLIVPVSELLPKGEISDFHERMHTLLVEYRKTLPIDRGRLFDRYRYVDLARKVVGVGSVGTRAWVILMIGRDSGDPLFLQAKEARPSVLEPFCGKSEFGNQGQRVVEGQKLMQAASDIFLGFLRTTGIDGKRRDFYIRQLWDWKTSAEVQSMLPSGMALYGRLCGWTLARAHARSGDSVAVAAYLGNGDAFDRSLTEFAERYAEQNDQDHLALLEAIESGRLEAIAGI